MKKLTIIFISLLGIMLGNSGCVNERVEQKITVQKQNSEENIFEDFKVVTKKEQVQKAIDIVKNANWENTKVKMTRYADYQFQFPSKESNNNEDKIASYLLWISPNGENIELVTDSQRYVQLTKQDSTDLYGILTGDILMK